MDMLRRQLTIKPIVRPCLTWKSSWKPAQTQLDTCACSSMLWSLTTQMIWPTPFSTRLKFKIRLLKLLISYFGVAAYWSIMDNWTWARSTLSKHWTWILTVLDSKNIGKILAEATSWRKKQLKQSREGKLSKLYSFTPIVRRSTRSTMHLTWIFGINRVALLQVSTCVMKLLKRSILVLDSIKRTSKLCSRSVKLCSSRKITKQLFSNTAKLSSWTQAPLACAKRCTNAN